MSFIDKAKNTAEKVAGEVKEAVGKATDDKDLQAEGSKDQTKGSDQTKASDQAKGKCKASRTRTPRQQ